MKQSFRNPTEGQGLPAFAWEIMSRQLRILQMLLAVRKVGKISGKGYTFLQSDCIFKNRDSMRRRWQTARHFQQNILWMQIRIFLQEKVALAMDSYAEADGNFEQAYSEDSTYENGNPHLSGISGKKIWRRTVHVT